MLLDAVIVAVLDRRILFYLVTPLEPCSIPLAQDRNLDVGLGSRFSHTCVDFFLDPLLLLSDVQNLVISRYLPWYHLASETSHSL